MKTCCKMFRFPALLPALAAVMIFMSGCSTTKRLEKGEILYTGVKPLKIDTPPGQKAPSGLKGEIKDAVNVAPNNVLISPYWRIPFPLGLWVYNNWSDPGHGFKHWLYEKLVAQPVLISDVRPEVRVKMIDEILDNNGFFAGSVSYGLVQGKNKRKASIRYNISTGPAYTLDSIISLPDTCHLYHLIDSVVGRSRYLKPGMRYSTDSLSSQRQQIAAAVRNKGYYYFNPEYIEYLADSTITPGRIALKLVVASNTPTHALKRYVVGRVTTRVLRNQGGGTPDTFMTSRGMVIQMMPSRLRRELIPECVTLRTGRYISVRSINRTQTYLSRLGIFSGIDVGITRDTLAAQPTVNVDLTCTFDTPLEASIEVNVTSKSNSYLGPGVTLGVTNRNIFGGGEQFNVSLTGSYEWQTGREASKSSVFNSYEFGLNTTLAFPRLIAPRFIPRRRRVLNWTRISLGADLLNRPHYFKLGQFNTAFSYDWQSSRFVSHTLNLFKLTYTKLMHTTHDFDSIMSANKAVAESFKSQFIPQVSYNFNFSRTYRRRNNLNISFTLQQAGNLCWGLWRAFGKETGHMKLFGTPLSQFVKGTAQVVYGRRFAGDLWLVSRAAVGAAHAYGNSSQVPYAEQFYVGGANSVRAFTVRSLGPGTYRPPKGLANGYFDQTGTFKFELNTELRFPIFKPVYGAVFLDSGNVWLLKDDPERPGGTLRGSSFFKDLALGTGVGLRVDIGMMVIRGDLGIGIHAPYRTSRSGYYNMESFGKSLAFHLAIGYPF